MYDQNRYTSNRYKNQEGGKMMIKVAVQPWVVHAHMYYVVRYNEIHSWCTRAAFEVVGPLCVLLRVECTIVSRC